MDLKGKKILVIGGGGLIGSHTVDRLRQEDVESIVIYDNFFRGREENLRDALKDPRVSIYEVGGDLLHTDILSAAMKGIDGVFHFAALWLLQCHDFPRSAFDVNIRGTFNVMEAPSRYVMSRGPWRESSVAGCTRLCHRMSRIEKCLRNAKRTQR